MHSFKLLLVLLVLVATPLSAEDEKEKTEPEAAPPTVSYYQVKPSLIANLASGGRYIRCDVQLMTDNESFLEALNLHGPAIRHTLLLLLSEQDGANLKIPSGKEALRQKALTTIGSLMKKLSGKNELKALYFTTFLVQ
jgi:flagellar FliL protein